MKEFTLKDPKYLPPKNPAEEAKYGKSYWSYTYDSDVPVMFNLMDGQVGDGSRITAETVELKTSGKGTEYHRLRKIKIVGEDNSRQIVSSSPVISDNSKLLELTYANTQQILKLLQPQSEPTPSLSASWKETTGQPAQDVVADLGDEEEINLDAIPF